MIDHHRSNAQKLHQPPPSLQTQYHDCQEDELSDDQQHYETPSGNKKPADGSNEQPSQGGYVWRFSSGLVSSTAGVLTGAVGLGVGGVKWVASKGISAGGAVVDTTKNIVGKVPVPVLKRKDKKE